MRVTLDVMSVWGIDNFYETIGKGSIAPSAVHVFYKNYGKFMVKGVTGHCSLKILRLTAIASIYALRYLLNISKKQALDIWALLQISKAWS